MTMTNTEIHESVEFEVDEPMTGDELNARDHACRVHSPVWTDSEGKAFDEGWRRARAFYRWQRDQEFLE